VVGFFWRYEFVGAARTWAVTLMFCATGVICGFVVPYALRPTAAPGSLPTPGVVLRLEAEDGMVRSVFQYTDSHGVPREFASGLWSNRPAYHVGDRVVLVFNPADSASVYVQDDKDLVSVLWILRILGLVFGGIGLAVLGMKLKGLNDQLISRIGGLIGALSFCIPASLVLPSMWIAHSLRPNWLFDAEASFGLDEWLLGSSFTASGLLGLVATIVLYRYLVRRGDAG
jgi:hypothetical protein